MRSLLFAAAVGVVGCAAQTQVVGPYAGQLSRADIQQITALMPADETISSTYTKLETIRPNQVHVTVGGFAREHGIPTSKPASYGFTATKRRDRWVTTGPVEVERTITVY